MSELLPCPFCGELPRVGTPEWRDDRRYIAIDVTCCAEMEIGIGFNRAKGLTIDQIKEELNNLACDRWNSRAIISPPKPSPQQ